MAGFDDQETNHPALGIHYKVSDVPDCTFPGFDVVAVQSQCASEIRIAAALVGVTIRARPINRPWALAFSFARAIQQPALELWQGKETHVLAAQQALYHRARFNRAARRGEYTAAMEKDMLETTNTLELARAAA